MAVLSGTPVIEMAFGDTWKTAKASRTWVDVTSDVLSIVSETGRQYELGRFETGTMTLILRNPNRDYEPGNTAGAYSPNIVPGCPVRFRVTYSSTATLWTGYVESWEVFYPHQNQEGRVVVSCVDGLQQLHREFFSTLRQEIAADSPLGWWRLDETSGTTAADSGSAGVDGTYVNTPTLDQTGPVTNSKAVDFDDASSEYVSIGTLTGATRENDWAVEMFVKLDSGDTTKQDLFQMGKWGSNNRAYKVYRLADGDDRIAIHYPTGTGINDNQAVALSNRALSDDAWHHLVINHDSDNDGWTLWVDGVKSEKGLVAPSDFDPTVLTGDMADVLIAASNPVSPAYADGAFAHVAVYTKQLSEGRIKAHYDAAYDRDFAAEGAHTRAGTILDAIGWPAADRDLHTGIGTLAAVTDPNGTVLALLRNAADSEGGEVFCDEDGDLTLWNRQTRAVDQATSQVTLTDDGGADAKFGDIRLVIDDDFIYTVVGITPAGGTEEVSADLTSQYGASKLSKTGLDMTQADALALAHYLRNRYETPAERVRGVVFQAEADPANLWPEVRDRKIGDRVTVEFTPFGGGAQKSIDGHIERIEHRHTSPAFWETVWELSPADQQGMWILGTSKLGQGTRLGW